MKEEETSADYADILRGYLRGKAGREEVSHREQGGTEKRMGEDVREAVLWLLINDDCLLLWVY